MTTLASILLALAGMCVYGSIAHLAAGLRRPFRPVHLVFAALSLCVAAHAYAHIGVYSASNMEEYLAARRSGNYAGALALALLPWFAQTYADARTHVRSAVLSTLYLASAVLSELFSGPPPVQLEQLVMPWGELAMIHRLEAPLPALWLLWLINIACLAHVAALCAGMRRAGREPAAFAMLCGVLVFMLGMFATTLVLLDVLDSLFLGEFGAIALVLLMVLSVGGDEAHRAQAVQTVLEERVAARTAELAKLNRQLEAFSYSVSHDLRAPVRIVSGYAQLLRDSLRDPESRAHVQRIQAAASEMSELIDGLLTLATLSNQPLNVERIDLSALTQEIIAAIREGQPTRRIEVVCEPGVEALADRTLMRVLLTNLLENAWKYSSRVENARIEFGRQREDGELWYYVRDNGAGFDMQQAARLFKPFQRLHSSHDFPGSGIGLATVAGIIDLHGGRIRAESAPGAGAAFYFTLRAEPNTNDALASPSDHSVPAEQPDADARRRLA